MARDAVRWLQEQQRPVWDRLALLVGVVGVVQSDADEQGKAVPDRPLLFLKPPNTVASHRETVELPAGKERLDFEAELGVVIGEECRHVAAEDAMDVVAGYTCVVDLSNRDDQRQEQNWVRGKAFDEAGIPHREMRKPL